MQKALNRVWSYITADIVLIVALHATLVAVAQLARPTLKIIFDAEISHVTHLYACIIAGMHLMWTSFTFVDLTYLLFGDREAFKHEKSFTRKAHSWLTLWLIIPPIVALLVLDYTIGFENRQVIESLLSKTILTIMALWYVRLMYFSNTKALTTANILLSGWNIAAFIVYITLTVLLIQMDPSKVHPLFKMQPELDSGIYQFMIYTAIGYSGVHFFTDLRTISPYDKFLFAIFTVSICTVVFMIGGVFALSPGPFIVSFFTGISMLLLFLKVYVYRWTFPLPASAQIVLIK